MPETPQQWFDRVSDALEKDGPVDIDWPSWSSWPWTGELTVKSLDPPEQAEPPRRGAGGDDCRGCQSSQEASEQQPGNLVWRDDDWMLIVPNEGSSLPFAAILMPRRHADLGDLTATEAARQGELLSAIETAACSVLSVPRIQVARWGDGGEHLHWILFGRPTGQLQLRGTFLSHWADVLPARPVEELRADLELVAGELVRLTGGQALPANSQP